MRAFLQRHPALFRLHDDMASAVGSVGPAGLDTDHRLNQSNPEVPSSVPPQSNSPPGAGSADSGELTNGFDRLSMSSCSSSTLSASVMMEVARESEAVRFFQSRLGRRREDRWVPIKSLAGRPPQPGPGRTKHRHVFEIQGELVGLRDTFAAVTTRQQEKQSQQQQQSLSSSSVCCRNPVGAQGGGGGGFLGGSMDDTFANSLPGTPAESNYNDEAFDDTG
uniref:DUF4817 domain-containing protein n=1 Tax=Macrostomum lignano TaxID=282301 RepID=A0A1I8I2V0_9PLAT